MMKAAWGIDTAHVDHAESLASRTVPAPAQSISALLF